MDSNREGEEADNVVRLPREWVGPLEELVPIGARARAREAERTREVSDAATEDSGDVDAVPTVHAHDFWSESAGAVHHAVQGPTPTQGAQTTSPSPGIARAGAARPSSRPRTMIAAAGALAAAAAIALVLEVAPRSAGAGAPAVSSGGSLANFAPLRSAVKTGLVDMGARVRHETQTAQSDALARADRHRQHIVARRSRELSRSFDLDLHRRRVAAARAVSQTRTSEQPTPVQTVSTPVAEPAVVGSTATSDGGSTSTASSSPQPAGPTGVGGATGCNPQCS